MELPENYHVWRWRGIAIWVVVFSMVCAYSINQNRTLSRETNDALCTFREDLQQRRLTTIQFLKDNPEFEPIPGVTRTTLLTNLRNQKLTLESLSGLDCTEDETLAQSVVALVSR